MIKICKINDSNELIYDFISEKLNEIGFNVLTKGQDYEKDLHIRIQSKENNKSDSNLAQSRANIKKILDEVSSKFNITCNFNLMLKSTNYIEGSIEIKEKVEDSATYFGTEKLKQLSKSGDAELYKSDGKKEYNDEYYIVINNQKEKLNANSDKDAVKKFKEMFKKKVLATDSVDNNNDVINFLQIVKDSLIKTNENVERALKFLENITADTNEEKLAYNKAIGVLEGVLTHNEFEDSKIDEAINLLRTAHIIQDQPLIDFGNTFVDRLNAGEKLEDLMKELEEIYTNMNDVDEKFLTEFEDIKSDLLRKNNIIARRKLKERNKGVK